MSREKDDLHGDSAYRSGFVTYDHHLLDGEMFLQVSFDNRTDVGNEIMQVA